jgi:hypothetical protein
LTKLPVTQAFEPIKIAVKDLQIDKDRILFGFYTMTYALKEKGTFSGGMSLNGALRPVATQTLGGNVRQGNVGGAFAEVVLGNAKDTKVGLSYLSTSEVDMDISKPDQNIAFGFLTFPNAQDSFYHFANKAAITMAKSTKANEWQRIPLEVNIRTNQPANYLVLFSFTIPGTLKGDFHVQLQTDTPSQSQILTTQSKGNLNSMNFHIGQVMTLSKSTKIFAQFQNPSLESLVSKTDIKNQYTQSITAIKLPTASALRHENIEKTIDLSGEPGWKVFAPKLDYTIDIAKPKKVLIIIKYNIKINGGTLGLRLKFDQAHTNPYSFTRVSEVQWASGTTYIIKPIEKPGKYKISLEREYIAATVAANGPSITPTVPQYVSLQVIEFE